MMMFAGLNLTAILVAAIAGWVVGALRYAIFGSLWADARALRARPSPAAAAAPEDRPAGYTPFALAFVANLVMAWILSGLLGHIGALSVRGGVISGAFVWFGFILTTMVVNSAFQGRPHRLTAIDAGHWLLAMIVMGAILGAWGA